ncbi:hypothetical protein PoB_007514400 [Plakobranchus ocellatus]|uniref:Uncharacterized protein n=1 Tax=Plakobranchus ocellatus TaxID=259542 RepID=A0AAV4DWR5_9GAST|nr:hypothetical protein PoB_007514400 [Plakobranchus ocellatus]
MSHHPYCDDSCFHSNKNKFSPIHNDNLQVKLDKDKRKNIELTFDMSKGAAIFTSGVIYAIITRILTRAQAAARLRSDGSVPCSENTNEHVYKITDIDLWNAFAEDDQLTQFQSMLNLLPKMSSEGSFMDNQRLSNLRNYKDLQENSQQLYKHGQNQLNKRRTQEQNLQLTVDLSNPFRAWHHAQKKRQSQRKDEIGLYLKERGESLSESAYWHHSFQSPNSVDVRVHDYCSTERSKSTAVTTSSFSCQSEPHIANSANTCTHTGNSSLPIACNHYRLFKHNITAATHFPNTPQKTERLLIERPKVPKFPKASKEQNCSSRVIGHDFHTLTRLIMLIGVWWLCASWIA